MQSDETNEAIPEPAFEREKREQWGSRFEFLLSCIGLSIGFGNVWRFPYLVYENGGVTFCFAYFVLLMLVGRPMYFLEIALGQFSSLSSVLMWRCCPVAQGVGISMQIITFLACIYYHVLVAYTVFYLAASFTPNLPWQDCYKWWGPNSTCFVRKPNELPSCAELKSKQNIKPGVNCKVYNFTRQTSEEQYWVRYVLHLHEANGIDHIGGIRWDLTLCLLFSWIVVFVCIFKGIKSSGKAVYFTVSFPFLMLLVVIIRGVTLDGAGEGLKKLFTLEWSRLVQLKVWNAAAEQMFYSLSISWGVLTMLGSYNGFHDKVQMISLIVTSLDVLTSLSCSIAIYSVLGHLAKQLNLDFDKVAAKGAGLAFVIYPEAIALLPFNQLWSVCFFIMLFMLGLDSQFAQVLSLLCNIYDYWPKTAKRKPWISLAACVILFLLGLTCVTSGGIYVLTLLDAFGAAQSVIFVGFCEMVAITWIYGVRRLKRDLDFMLNTNLSIFWLITWAYISPLTLLMLFILSIVYYEPLSYAEYKYPPWAIAVGWTIEGICIAQIPIWAVVELIYYWRKGNIRAAFKPTVDWGPAEAERREEWLAVTGPPEIISPKLKFLRYAFR